MHAQVQRSYNWVYGVVSGAARMLPFLEQSVERIPQLESAGRTLEMYFLRMRDAADDLASLAEYLDSEELRKAEGHLRRTASGMESCIDACSSSDALRLSIHLRGVIAGLEQTIAAMRSQSRVRYRPWLWNPWRYYPRRLGSPPLPPGPKGLQ